MRDWLLLLRLPLLLWQLPATRSLFGKREYRRPNAGLEVQWLAPQIHPWGLALDPPSPHRRRPARALTAASKLGVSASTNQFLALPWRLHRRWRPNRTHDEKPEHWLQPRLLVRRATRSRPLPPRHTLCGHNSWICHLWTEDTTPQQLLGQWTDVRASQDPTKTMPSCSPSLTTGSLQSARCWRLSSARCCALSVLSALPGLSHPVSAFQCAPHISPRTYYPCPMPWTQVLPSLPTAGAGSASLYHTGASQCWDGFEWGPSLGIQLCTSGSWGSVPSVLPPAVPPGCVTSFRLLAFPPRSGSFGFLHTLLQQSIRHLGDFHTSEPTDQLPSWVAYVPFRYSRCRPVIYAASRAKDSSALVSTIGVHALKPSRGNCSGFHHCLRPGMGRRGKRGQRAGRRRRPRDSARESDRPPKRVRDALHDASPDDGSSSEGTEAADQEPCGSSARPLTVFSAPMTRCTDAGQRAEDEDQVFDVRDLRVERSPEEFMALATALGRSYALPASTSARPAPAPAPERRPPMPPVASARTHTGGRQWPAGALPPQQGPLEHTARARRGPSVPQTTARPAASVGTRRSPGREIQFRSAIGEARTHDGETSTGMPTPVTKVSAKPRPKARGRAQTRSEAGAGTRGTTVLVPPGETPPGPSVDPSPPIDDLDLGQLRSQDSPATDGPGMMERNMISQSGSAPSLREYAKPRPKVRARDRDQTCSATVDGASASSSAPPGELATALSTDSRTSQVSTALDQARLCETPQGSDGHDVSWEATAEGVQPEEAASGDALAAIGTTPSVRVATSVDQGVAEPEPPCAAEELDSSSDEDTDDYMLMRLRCRGDLPVKISTSTGLPSGVASLRRDQSTGRIRVVCPPGFSIAHRGTVLTTAAGTLLFLDEISGFEPRPDAQQPYMQGWMGSGFAVRLQRLSPFTCIPAKHGILVRLLAPSATATQAPLCSLPLPRPCDDTSPLNCHAYVPPFYRRCCQRRGCGPRRFYEPSGSRCYSVPSCSPAALIFSCAYGNAIGGFLGCRLFQGALPTLGLASVVAPLCRSKPLHCHGEIRRIGRSRLPRLFTPVQAPPGCSAQCLPRQLQPRLPVGCFSVHGLAYGYYSRTSTLESLWVLVRQPLWYVPTLLKPLCFCRHPWARRPRRTHQTSSRGTRRCRPPIVPPRQQCAQPHGVALAPVVFHFWNLWTACLQILGRHMTGGASCTAIPWEVLGPYLRSLACSHACLHFLSVRLDTHTPHTLHSYTIASDLHNMGTNRFARETFESSHCMQGSPGPKSGRCSSFACCRPLSSLGLLLLHIQAARATTTSDVRVPLASQVSGEAGRSAPAPRQAPAKPLGTQDATCRSPLPSLQRQRIVKRSLQRVHRRILRTGVAWYKGKWYNQDTASALTNALHDVPISAATKPRPTHLTTQDSAPCKPSPRHLQVYTWNVGGLGGGLYDEILYYIHQHPVDVLMIQETKWRFSSSWDTHQYIFVHSGSQEPDFKQGGLLTVVAKRLLDPGTLRYVDVIPGRLLRIQFHRHSQPCDLLNFYQHTWRATDHVRRLRHQALDQLTRTVNMIPKRSLMIIGGDFNASCISSSPHVGSHVLARSQTWDTDQTDQEDLQALILGLDLCALNTFQSTHPLHTYMWGTQRSHIDFLLIRREMADSLSKQSYAMHDHPLGAWRGGARHFLVFAQVPTHWRPWSGQARPTSSPVVDRHAIADALAGKADPRIQAFRQDLQLALSDSPASVSDLHDAVYSLAVQHFPKKAPIRGPRPWQDGTLQQYASLMWGHLRALRRWAARPGSSASAQAMFRCWRHSVQYFRMHRRAQQQGRDLRKQRRISLLTEADQAIRHGHSRLFYQLIDKLAPKGRFRKFQLSKGGNILSPSEELEVMRKHFVQVFNSDDPAGPAQVATPSALVPRYEVRQCMLATHFH